MERLLEQLLVLAEKPADGSDFTLTQAKNEVKDIRKLARDFQGVIRAELSKYRVLDPRQQERDRVIHGEIPLEKNVISPADYELKVVPKSADAEDIITHGVNTNMLFSSFSEEERIALVDSFERIEVASEDVVIQQGDVGDRFYVVEEGILDVWVQAWGSNELQMTGTTLEAGSCFGELSLMHKSPRHATVKAVTSCVLWYLDRATLQNTLSHMRYLHNAQYIEILQNVCIDGKYLGNLLSEAQLENMVAALQKVTYHQDDVFIRQGEPGNSFFIIEEGVVGVYRLPTESENGSSSIFPSDQSRLVALGLQGTDKIAEIHKGDYFGEMALISDNIRHAAVVAESDVVELLALNREEFVKMLGPFEQLMRQPRKLSAPPAAAAVDRSYEANYSLEDLEIFKTIGKGAFGLVKLCKPKGSNIAMALKCQSKDNIVSNSLQSQVMNELEIMRQTKHSCISRLQCAMQDEKYVYFLLDLVPGGELHDYIKSRKGFTESESRFFSSNIVLALSHLHAHGIAYRDLKPENLLLTRTGYLKVVDFGLAKFVFSGKTYTLCGTPDYLAPEVVRYEGHGTAVDYWALGCVVYEMMTGFPPFYGKEVQDIYDKILSGFISYPEDFSSDLVAFLKQLLTQSPSLRLGNTCGGVSMLQEHEWYSSDTNFDWEQIAEGSFNSPILPNVINDDVEQTSFVDQDCDSVASSSWWPDLA